MTSTGIRNRRTTDEKIGDTINNTNDEYIQRARKGIADSSPITGNAGRPAASGSTTPGASTLDPAGGAMFGTLAYNPQALAISDGRVDIQANQSGASKASSYILVTGQGSPDDLNFIDGADKNGQILDFQGTITQIINIKHADIGTISNIVGTGTVTVTTTINHNITTGEKGNILSTTNFNVQNVVFTKTGANTFTYPATGSTTPETSGTFQRGNILTSDGADVALDGTKFANAVPWVSMKFDPTVLGFGAWRVQFGAGGGTGVSFPITPTVSIRGNVNTTQNIDLSLATAHSTSMTLTSDISITFSGFPATGTQIEWELEITQDGTGGHVITWPAEVVNPPPLVTAAASVVVVVFRTNDNGTTVRVGNTVTTGSSVSQWANFPAVNDVNFATFDGTNIDRLLLDQAAGGSLAAGVTGITSTVLGDLSQNVPTGGSYFGSINGVNILTLQIPTADPVFQIRGNSTNIPIIRTFQEKGSAPTLGTFVGRWQFYGTDSTGSTQEEFASITADYEDVTIGAVDGSLHLNVSKSSSTTAFVSLNNNDDNKISLWRNLFMTTGRDIELNDNDLILDAAGEKFITSDGVGMDIHSDGVGDTVGIHVDSVLQTFSATGLQLGATANLDLFARAARLTPSTATFLSDGDISYNSTDNEFRFRQNGATLTLGGGSSVFADDVFRIQDNGDATKQLAFEVSAITTATTRTITMLNEDLTIVGRSSTQILQNKSFEDSNTVFLDTVAQTKKMAFDISPVTAGQTRTLSVQDQNGTIALLEGAAQTWTGVNTYSGLATFNANVVIGNAASDTVTINADIASNLIPNDGTRNIGDSVNGWNNIFSDNTLFCSNFKVWTGDSDINVFDDFDMQAGATVDYADTATTAGTSSQTLPAQPDGFIIIKVNGASKRVPFYVP